MKVILGQLNIRRQVKENKCILHFHKNSPARLSTRKLFLQLAIHRLLLYLRHCLPSQGVKNYFTNGPALEEVILMTERVIKLHSKIYMKLLILFMENLLSPTS
jgi:hypothetical protein